jgi:tellurite resistance protein TerC
VPPSHSTALTETISNPLMWAGFVLFMLAAMVVDLGLGRRNKAMSVRAALIWCAVWVSLALAFNGWIYFAFGRTPAEEFFAGYLLEKSLSVDNLFVFALIFAYFRTPAELQHRALVWGIIGAMVLRAAMILAGAALITTWTLVLFGGFLILTGVKLLFTQEDDDISKSRLVKFLRNHLRIIEGYRGDKFWVVENGQRHFTYLFLTVVVVEFSDVAFAVDSIPAIFGVTTDPFIVFTSNMFAILGLRALYFAIAAAIQKLQFLNYGLAIVLSFIGFKMILGYAHDVLKGKEIASLAGLIPVEWLKIDTRTSLGVICGVLVLTAVLSVVFRPAPQSESEAKPDAQADPVAETAKEETP